MDATKLPDLRAEYLEADGLGGFASGTVSGERTRRYHALLLTSMAPPTNRYVLVNGFDAWLDTPSGGAALSAQRYAPDVVHPDGASRLVAFTTDPWPSWRYRLGDGTEIEQQVFVPHGAPAAVVSWRLLKRGAAIGAADPIRLWVRPFLSGRDLHSLHHENSSFRFDAELAGPRVRWKPYEGLPAIAAWSNGVYRHDPAWYRSFLYAEERARELDFVEDLGSPGLFTWDLVKGEAVWMLAALGAPATDPDVIPPWVPPHAAAAAPVPNLTDHVRALRTAEKRRRAKFSSRLHRAADAYLVQRGSCKTIIAGYPWFTDWGRDTFIAMRGVCIATGRLEDAGNILHEWAGTVSEGMLPNRFPDQGDTPEYNSVDASLWYVIAVHDWFAAMAAAKKRIAVARRRALETAVEAILDGYARGTRYGIRCDDDGLIACGAPGVQLTWMDSKIGDWVVTPRTGKPVEIQALWLAALRMNALRSQRWAQLLERGNTSFAERFWNPEGEYLYDVVDVDHVRGTVDRTFRPNQILAIGGLPVTILGGERAARVVEQVERRLWTPLGLRSLAPGERDYRPRYEGGVFQRDSSYHQGTVWPWLVGPFVEAWLRVHENSAEARAEARARFVEPLLQHLGDAGLDHISEIADADPTHTPRGCPFQAWSVAELARIESVLAAAEMSAPATEAFGAMPRG